MAVQGLLWSLIQLLLLLLLTGIMRSYIRTGTMAYLGYDRMGRTSKAGRRAFGSSSTDLDALKGGRHWGTLEHTTIITHHCRRHFARIITSQLKCAHSTAGPKPR